MSPEEIRRRYDVAYNEVRRAEADLIVAKAKVTAVQSLCDHPDSFIKNHYDGSISRVCTDCEWSG